MSFKHLSDRKNKGWLWTAVDGKRPGILAWQLGDRGLETYWPLWLVVRGWKCFLYITNGWPVYAGSIDDGDHLVSKTAMYREEGENTRLRHYLARLTRKSLCYSKWEPMLKHSIRLLLHYLRYRYVPTPSAPECATLQSEC